jgi:hypothetical protein
LRRARPQSDSVDIATRGVAQWIKVCQFGGVVSRPSIIGKGSAAGQLAPNWIDYDGLRATFSWTAARRELAGLPNGGLNIAHEALERHASGAARDKTAFRFLGADHRHDLSYLELSLLTNRFANVLRTLGVGKGERVFVLAGRIPELGVAILGSFKNASGLSAVFRVRLGTDRHPPRHWRRARAGHDGTAVPAQDHADPGPAARAAPCAAGARG